ncbi:MAG: hypothetical protein DRG30_05770 [Epsilonproteobacteria bacterium]|nr:MAG: hypothetical protein DRG30_05770 [Campylobacterota bacterium]
MAKLNLDIVVNGEGKIKALNQSLTTTETKTAKLNAGFKKLYTSLSQIATVGVTAAFAGLAVATTSLVKSGFEFNASMEEQKAGLTALAMAVNKDAIPATEKLMLAQQEASVVMEELILINAKTPHSLSQTNEIYKAMYVSMKNVGASTKDIIDITQKLSVASGAAGIEFNSLLAGVDGLATGTVLANSDLGRFLGSLGLTNDALKNTNDIVGLVNEKLKDFTGFDTMATSVSNLKNEWSMLGGELTKDIFASVKLGIDEVSSKMHNLGTEGIDMLKDKFNNLAVVMATAAGGMVKAIGWIAEKIYAVTILFENAWLQASNFFSWNEKLQKQVEDNRQSFVAFQEGVQGANIAIDNIVTSFKKGIEVAKEQSMALKAINALTVELAQKKMELKTAIDFESDAARKLNIIRELSSTTTEELITQENILAFAVDNVKNKTQALKDAEILMTEARKNSTSQTITLTEKTKILTDKRKVDTVATDESTKASIRKSNALRNEIQTQMALSRALWETTALLKTGETISNQAEFTPKNETSPLHESDFNREGSFGYESNEATKSADNLSSSLSNLDNTYENTSKGMETYTKSFSSSTDGFVESANRIEKATSIITGAWNGSAITASKKKHNLSSNSMMAIAAEKRRGAPTSMHTGLYSGMYLGSSDLATGGFNFGTSFSRGGFTGTGRDDEIAGVVHKNEYVLTSSETKELRGGGFPGTLLNDTARPSSGGILLDNMTRPSSNNSSDFIPTLIDNTVAQLAMLGELVNLGKKNNTKLTQLLGVTVGGTA